jgi:SAM-dependent methyltransferase
MWAMIEKLRMRSICGGKGYVAAVEWGHGRYEVIAEQLFPAAEVVIDQAAPADGDRVLDLGCGTGNAALLAAERGAAVTGVDPAERLISVAEDEAAERGLGAKFVVGDAENIPVPDDSVDVVVSVFGVIFAPDAEAAAAEIDRVTAPGGRVVITAWIPEGTMFRAVRLMRETIGPLLDEPPPPPPFAWHEQGALEGLFGPRGFTVTVQGHDLPFSARSPEAFVRTEEENHPLAFRARPAILEAGLADALRQGMVEIYAEGNEDPSGFRVTSRYAVAELVRGTP